MNLPFTTAEVTIRWIKAIPLTLSAAFSVTGVVFYFRLIFDWNETLLGVMNF